MAFECNPFIWIDSKRCMRTLKLAPAVPGTVVACVPCPIHQAIAVLSTAVCRHCRAGLLASRRLEPHRLDTLLPGQGQPARGHHATSSGRGVTHYSWLCVVLPAAGWLPSEPPVKSQQPSSHGPCDSAYDRLRLLRPVAVSCARSASLGRRRLSEATGGPCSVVVWLLRRREAELGGVQQHRRRRWRRRQHSTPANDILR